MRISCFSLSCVIVSRMFGGFGSLIGQNKAFHDVTLGSRRQLIDSSKKSIMLVAALVISYHSCWYAVKISVNWRGYMNILFPEVNGFVSWTGVTWQTWSLSRCVWRASRHSEFRVSPQSDILIKVVVIKTCQMAAIGVFQPLLKGQHATLLKIAASLFLS